MDYILAENKYGQYAIPHGVERRPAAHLAIIGEVYEPDTIQFILDNVKSGCIIHAGAFFGDFLPALGSIPNATVYAFEPVEDNYLHAAETLRLNVLEKVILTHGALGDKDGTVQIMKVDHLGQKLGGGSLLGFSIHNAEPVQLEDTKIYALDGLGIPKDDVALIHLDVEGHEELALRGAMEMIKASKPILILEQWNDDMLDGEFYQNEIFPLGYERGPMLHENVVLLPI